MQFRRGLNRFSDCAVLKEKGEEKKEKRVKKCLWSKYAGVVSSKFVKIHASTILLYLRRLYWLYLPDDTVKLQNDLYPKIVSNEFSMNGLYSTSRNDRSAISFNKQALPWDKMYHFVTRWRREGDVTNGISSESSWLSVSSIHMKIIVRDILIAIL